MQKSIILSTLLALGISSHTLAKTTHINYNGTRVDTALHLKKNDVVMIDTTVKIGEHFYVEAKLKNPSSAEKANFTFNSSVVGVEPERQCEFWDSIYTGASPGWVSYTFTGKNETDAVFSIHR
jgi:hypothetical protein